MTKLYTHPSVHTTDAIDATTHWLFLLNKEEKNMAMTVKMEVQPEDIIQAVKRMKKGAKEGLLRGPARLDVSGVSSEYPRREDRL